VGDRLDAGRFDGRQPVGEHRREDVDHLPIAVLGAGELAPHPLHRGRQNPAVEGGPVAQGAGLSGEYRDVMPGVVNRLAAAKGTGMLGDHPSVLASRSGRHRRKPRPDARRRSPPPSTCCCRSAPDRSRDRRRHLLPEHGIIYPSIYFTGAVTAILRRSCNSSVDAQCSVAEQGCGARRFAARASETARQSSLRPETGQRFAEAGVSRIHGQLQS